MRHLAYLKIHRFKRFGDEQRIELEHPSVLIGPNNCGKTTVIQALALWSQAVRAWYEARNKSSAKKRPGIPLNRLSIVAVPVQRTHFFWHGMQVRIGNNNNLPIIITVGVIYKDGKARELSMHFRNDGEELVYCNPDSEAAKDLEFVAYVSKLRVELLYPMSGLASEEPILKPGRVDVLLGQGRTAEVLRNLCLTVFQTSADDWKRITGLMHRLFRVEISDPVETTLGAISLYYKQNGVKEELDISSAGRGFLQMLLVFAYLYSHKNSVVLIDEPDAHLEILRQKQVYVLLRDIAAENKSQVVIVTHSEVILNEALDTNLTLLLDGKSESLPKKQDILNSLRFFGAEHYVKARECGSVLYVEGSTDLDMMHEFAKLLKHPVAEIWDERRINSFYVQNNHPEKTTKADLERVEGEFQITPKDHFNSLRGLLPNLKGLAILDRDGRNKEDSDWGALTIRFWNAYELENYFITPDVLNKYVRKQYPVDDLFVRQEFIDEALSKAVVEKIFEGKLDQYETWAKSPADARNLIWEAITKDKKMSALAESFFENLAQKTGSAPLLRKGDFFRLIEHANPTATAIGEIRQKLDLLHELLNSTATRQ